MTGGLEGRTAIVSGGARGIGAAHVRALHEAGAHVVIADVLDDVAVSLANELGDRATAAHLDVTQPAAWTEVVALAEDASSTPVSILVNNAGITRPAAIAEMDFDVWRQVMAVNIDGHFLGIKAVIEPMTRAGGGAIVNTSSMVARQRTNGMAPYAASKEGVIGLTRVAALELARFGIRVNAIFPGMIETDMTARSDREATYPRIPLRRYGTPDEVAATMLFIVRDATYATGDDFYIDGGILAGRER